MFTGIIQALGSLHSREQRQQDVQLIIHSDKLPLQESRIGDSVAVDGVCLTITRLDPPYFTADVSNETLKHTTLGKKSLGDPLNLETALTLSTPLGGHLVSGHVDATATLVERYRDGRSEHLSIQVPEKLVRYIAPKGSVCINGVSLTVNAVHNNIIHLNIVPHTLQVTTLAKLKPTDQVNLEVDLIARYLEQLLHKQEDSGDLANKLQTLGYSDLLS